RPNSLNNVNGALAVDNNLDGLGDGTTLTSTFADFSINLSGSGTILELRARFSTNALQEEMAIDNFRLFSAGIVPVTLVSFAGLSASNQNKLSWVTASEQNSSYFQIERSTDARGFEPIGKITAAGNSTTTQHYNFTDNNISGGKFYYRLKQVDVDGSFT